MEKLFGTIVNGFDFGKTEERSELDFTKKIPISSIGFWYLKTSESKIDDDNFYIEFTTTLNFHSRTLELLLLLV